MAEPRPAAREPDLRSYALPARSRAQIAARMKSEPGPKARRRAAGRSDAADSSMRLAVSKLNEARIVRAMSEIVAEEGVEAASVARVTALACCSRRTFYDLYADRYDCFLAVLREAVARAEAHARPAYEAERRWTDGLRAGLHALLEFFDGEPGLARICLVLSPAGGAPSLEYRATVLVELAEIVDRGRAVSRSEPAEIVAEAVVGGCIAIAQNRIVRADREPLVGLLGPLMAVIVGPYLGSARAVHELRRGSQLAHLHDRRRQPADRPVKPPKRLTRRTMLVLSAIAGLPGMSNRAVAEAAGVSDQGQISKLLRRQQALGLIENAGAGKGGRDPNSWTVTPAGAALVRAFNSEY